MHNSLGVSFKSVFFVSYAIVFSQQEFLVLRFGVTLCNVQNRQAGGFEDITVLMQLLLLLSIPFSANKHGYTYTESAKNRLPSMSNFCPLYETQLPIPFSHQPLLQE